MNPSQSSLLPASETRLLDLKSLVDYLSARGWKERAGVGKGLARIFYRPERRIMEVSIPLDPTLEDYDHLIARGIATISAFESAIDVSRSQLAVFEDLMFYSADVIELAEMSKDAESGTISFERGQELFDGIRQSLQAMAHMEANPQPIHPRTNGKESELLLSRCRLCQTKRGSFILSVACPLNAVPAKPNSPSSTIPHLGFARSVTARFADAVKVLVESADTNNIDAAIHADDTQKLSANLCDGILLLSPEYPGGEVSVAVRWAKSQPMKSEFETPTPVVLKYEYKAFIEEVRSHLQLSAKIPESVQDFFGRIASLSGEFDDRNNRQGLVVFNVTDSDGHKYKVRVNLNQKDHAAAHRAYLDPDVSILFRGVLRGSGSTRTVENYSDFQIRRSASV